MECVHPSLLDNAQANRPERTTALVGRELARYKVDIAALSETRLAEEGQLKETGAGFTFFWSGRAKDDRREAGVGFAVRNELVNKLSSRPPGMNKRIMTMKLTLTGKKQATTISAYAPTMTNPDHMEDHKFYEELNSPVTAVPKTSMPESVWITSPGRTSSVRMAVVDVTATAFSSCSSVLNMNFWFPYNVPSPCP